MAANKQLLNLPLLTEMALAIKQDALDIKETQYIHGVKEITALQAAVAVMESKLAAAAVREAAVCQQLSVSQDSLAASQQLLAEQQQVVKQLQASSLCSQDSIAALQGHLSQNALAEQASAGRYQTLAAELEVQHEQLQQEKAKLADAVHAAQAAQVAATKLQARLTQQQTEAADQQELYTQALQSDSASVTQLQVAAVAMQDKVFAADHAIAAYQAQAQAQGAQADGAQLQVLEMVQQLDFKDSTIDSLQAALKTASLGTDASAQLISSLQASASGAEAMNSVIMDTMQRQLDQQTVLNASLGTEVKNLQSKLALADQTITALQGSILKSEYGSFAMQQNVVDKQVSICSLNRIFELAGALRACTKCVKHKSSATSTGSECAHAGRTIANRSLLTELFRANQEGCANSW